MGSFLGISLALPVGKCIFVPLKKYQHRQAMDHTLLFFNLGTGEIIIIAIVILLLFGGKKIPELMRGIGKGVRSFKEGVNDVKDEIEKPIEDNSDKGKGK